MVLLPAVVDCWIGMLRLDDLGFLRHASELLGLGFTEIAAFMVYRLVGMPSILQHHDCRSCKDYIAGTWIDCFRRLKTQRFSCVHIGKREHGACLYVM